MPGSPKFLPNLDRKRHSNLLRVFDVMRQARDSGSGGAGGLQPPHFCRIINNFLFISPRSTHLDLKTQFLYKTFIDWVPMYQLGFLHLIQRGAANPKIFAQKVAAHQRIWNVKENFWNTLAW